MYYIIKNKRNTLAKKNKTKKKQYRKKAILTIFRRPVEDGFTPRTASLFIEHTHGYIVHRVHLKTGCFVRGNNVIGEHIVLVTGDFLAVLTFGVDEELVFDRITVPSIPWWRLPFHF